MICQSRGSACRVLRSLNSIPHFLALVKGFLKSFSKKFAVFLLVHQPPLFWPLFDSLLLHSLHIIALLFLFVKRFFASFFTLETIAVCHKNVVAVLCKMRITKQKAPLPKEKGSYHRHHTAHQKQERKEARKHRKQGFCRKGHPFYIRPLGMLLLINDGNGLGYVLVFSV